MDNNQDVAIFWNLGKAWPATGTTGYAVLERIRTIAHTFGSVKSFRVYFDNSRMPSALNHLRVEFHQCGVSVIDCTGNSCDGDYADKAMSVDTIFYAVDHPSSTIVIISSEADFAYLISTLRLRKHRIVLVAPSNIHIGLKAQANHVIDCDFLGLVFKQAGIELASRHEDSEVIRPLTGNNVEVPSQEPDVPPRAAGTSWPSSDIETVLRYDTDTQQILGTSNAAGHTASQHRTSTFNTGFSNQIPAPRIPVTQPMRVEINNEIGHFFPFSEPGDVTTPVSIVKGGSPDLRLPNPFSGSLEQQSLPPILQSTHVAVQDCATSSKRYEPTTRTVSDISDASASSFSVVSSVLPSLEQGSRDRLSADFSASKTDNIVESKRPQTVPPFTPEPKASLPVPAYMTCEPVKPTPKIPHSTSLPEGNEFSSDAAPLADQENAPTISAGPGPPSSSSLPNVIPTTYVPLVNILKRHLQSRGKVQAERSIVAAELKKLDSEVYKKANTANFKQYSIKAEAAGLVHLGHDEHKTAWIALRPEWRDSVSLGPSQYNADNPLH